MSIITDEGFNYSQLSRLIKTTDELEEEATSLSEKNRQLNQDKCQLVDNYLEGRILFRNCSLKTWLTHFLLQQQALALYYDAESLFKAQNDLQYQKLLNNRKLDPEFSDMRDKILKAADNIKTYIIEMDNYLQHIVGAQRRKETVIVTNFLSSQDNY